MSLLKEQSYDKVLINAANKNYVRKNEEEYKHNLFLKGANGFEMKAVVDDQILGKLNLVTLKYRPTCSFSECKVGFKWFESSNIILSEDAFRKG